MYILIYLPIYKLSIYIGVYIQYIYKLSLVYIRVCTHKYVNGKFYNVLLKGGPCGAYYWQEGTKHESEIS